MARPEIENKQEYVKLLDLLARVNDAVDVSSVSDAGELERLRDANNLANKFISHAVIILHLLDDTRVQLLPSFPPHKIISFSSASIDVLTRTSLEAFLVFHYVFAAPANDEKDFRYWAYKAGIAERQDFPTITDEGRRTLDNDKKALEELHTKLRSNIVFQGLTGKQKKRIRKGEWRLLAWRDIAIDAGFSNILAQYHYSFLSGSVHSSSLSVLKMVQALTNKELPILITPQIATMNIIIANMIKEYCGLFPKSRDILSEDLEGSNLVEQWIQIGHGLDNHIGT